LSHAGESSGITQLLQEVASGNRDAESRLFELVYQELHRLAASYMRRELRPGHTLQASALVNEAYLRLLGQGPVSWDNRAHFFVTAAHTMRRILVDHARTRLAGKRTGGDRQVQLDEAFAFVEEHPGRFVDLDEALERLSRNDARQAQIVELRFFAGMTVEEVAGILQISEKTVKRDWAMARAWLENQLTPQ
jgi:RNA polymerase sigma factor (TIGR02999 family)